MKWLLLFSLLPTLLFAQPHHHRRHKMISTFDPSAYMTVSRTSSAFNKDFLIGYFDQTVAHGAARVWARLDWGDETLDWDRALLQFNTSAIPDNHTILKVELIQNFAETPTFTEAASVPDNITYADTRIHLLATPLTLAANEATWNAGTFCAATDSLTAGGEINLGETANGLVSKTGTTTVNIRRSDLEGLSNETESVYLTVGSSKYAVSGTPAQLRVTHIKPIRRWFFRASM